MMTIVSHLRSLQALELSIRKGSLKDAAAELAITPAALGQRIRAIEDYLGFDLIVRGRSGTRATKELEAAMAHLSAGFRELETVARILDFQRVNEIHITADSDWAELWLQPRLPEFQKENPNILFCINGTGDIPVRLGKSDCEIWFGEERGSETEDVLFRDYLAPVGSPENTKRISGQPKNTMLEGFPLLHLDCYTLNEGGIGWPEWIGKYGYRKTSPGLGIRYKNVMHALEAVYANAGFLVCGIGLIKQKIEEGQLDTPFPIEEGQWSNHSYRIEFQHDSLRRQQTEIFRDWLLTQAKASMLELKEMVGDRA
ncbi:MAG: LysR family transcriptional regulator [Proteobacteria bacterium]|nr:LysR family transcriptional regulator [Pseudomonadota bacterium]